MYMTTPLRVMGGDSQLCEDASPPKTCSRCKEEKSVVEFNKDSGRKSGLRSQCKSCRSTSYKAREQKYPGRLAAQQKRYYENHKEEIAKQHKEHNQTPAGRISQRRNTIRQREKFPEKTRAVHAVGKAIRRGTLVRPTICSSCFRERFVEGHHPDYSKPLSVKWLCLECHMEIHCKILTGVGQ